MNTKIMKILSVLSLSVFFNTGCFELLVPTKVNKLNKVANKKLINAVDSNNLFEVQEALKEGADINFESDFSTADNRDLEGLVQFHIEKLSDPTDKIQFDYMPTALLHAVVLGHFDIAQYLIKEGANIGNKDRGQLLFNALVILDRKKNISSIHLQKVIDFCLKLLGININETRSILLNEDSIEESFNLYEFLPPLGLNVIKSLFFNGLIIPSSLFKHELRNLNKDQIDYLIESGDFEKMAIVLSEQNFLKRLPKLFKVKGVSYSEIVKQVNQAIRGKLINTNIFPNDLSNLTAEYSFYSENAEDFFKLSNDQINELVRDYYKIKEEAEKSSGKECIVM